MKSLDELILAFLDNPLNVLFLGGFIVAAILCVANWQQSMLIFKSLFRNIIRSALVSLAIMLLVFIITMVWTITGQLDAVTAEKTKDFKAIVTEKWQVPSQLPPSFERELSEGAARKPGDIRPQDSMAWGFYLGTIDKDHNTRENMVFLLSVDPAKVLRFENDKPVSMLDDIDQLSKTDLDALSAACKEMDKDPQKVVIGVERLEAMKKRVGDTILVSSINYANIDLELKIIGQFPKGRYAQSAVMNSRYLQQSLDDYARKNGQAHPMADKSLSLMWLRIPDMQNFNKIADQIEDSPSFRAPAVKCETASNGFASFLQSYQGLLSVIKWALVPAILATMALVIACAISIGVRERQKEMAVLKVLGFGPNHILVLILGEALLLGVTSGLLSSFLTYAIFNWGFGGINFRVAFFPTFPVPGAALRWGASVGLLTSFIGSIVPAWSARSVKVSEVFSKVA